MQLEGDSERRTEMKTVGRSGTGERLLEEATAQRGLGRARGAVLGACAEPFKVLVGEMGVVAWRCRRRRLTRSPGAFFPLPLVFSLTTRVSVVAFDRHDAPSLCHAAS